MIEERPDPDKLLKRIQAEEQENAAAKIKIFFGPYPGVGKTFAMLEAARERKREGLDVVVGLVETHGRPETAALLKDLEVLSRKEISYKGITLHEFDLDAALARKPDLIILDELAHTNPEGSRHAKRWQDVEELLDAGIAVYTTLNVQHWESLNDIVAQITGVRVRETVPDSFLQKAAEVELVDLPPADLLKRMSEGKVYVADQAIRAAENFFQVGNLIALRELALRHTAERVDAEMQEFKTRYAISKILPVKDRLLVGITASPHSARLVRATLRLATSLRCEWITVYVQTPEHEKLPADQKARIIDTLRLAERLGGETAVLTGQNISQELLTYARQRNVTKIVVGKPSEPRWKEFLFGSIVNDIARRSGEIDLYVISTTDISDESPRRYKSDKKPERKGFLQATLLVTIFTVISHFLVNKLDRTNLIMLYLLIVLWIAYKYGRNAGIFASVISVLAFDFFLVPPYFTFAVSDTEYFITFIVMLMVAIFISTITGRLFAYASATRNREARLKSLYRVSRTLSETPDQNQMLQAVEREIEEFFKAPVLLLTPDASIKLRVAAGDPQKFGFSGNEIRTAEWVYRKGEIAGHGTDTLAGSKGTYVPLKGREKVSGVLAIRLQEQSQLIEPEQLQALETFASEIGEALESKEFSEAAVRATSSMEAERLKNLVLRSFSYDLAAPSQEISEAARRISRSRENKMEFAKSIHTLVEKCDQINRVVERLPEYLQDAFPGQSINTGKKADLKSKESLELISVLALERILFFSNSDSKEYIIKSLVDVLHLANAEKVFRSIQEREQVGGILIRPNVAIPHTTIDDLQGVNASLGIQHGENDDTFFWLVFVSGTESPKEHLCFLRSVAQSLNDETLHQLANAKNAGEAYWILSGSSVLR